VTVAYGLFALGLVLGWSTLFLRASSWRSRVAQLLWLAVLILLIAAAPAPLTIAWGVATGAIFHLLLQLGLEERRA
jgi:hypothetical protein